MSLINNKSKIQSILDTVNSLPENAELDVLDNPGNANTMLAGTEMLDGSGKKVTGTIETKTSSNLTASGATVTVPAGYYASDASKSIQSGALSLSLGIDNTGLISADVITDSEGYISSTYSKSDTIALPVQEAKTITPTKSTQTAVAKNVYTTGAVTVAAIPSQYQDVSGVTATAAGTLSGQKFVNSSGTTVTGTMPNNGAISKTINALTETSVTVPSGYTSGGTVSLTNDLANEVEDQSELLDLALAALEGKAGGGGSSMVSTTNVSWTGSSSGYIAIYTAVGNDGSLNQTSTGNSTISDVASNTFMAFMNMAGDGKTPSVTVSSEDWMSSLLTSCSDYAFVRIGPSDTTITIS